MKPLQFWISIICSIVVSVLLIKTVLLNRALDVEQRTLVDSQETASSATVYEEAWKQLAVKIYQTGHQDPVMIDLLKSEGVNINFGTPPPAPGTAAPANGVKPLITPQNMPHPAGT
jgi:hypothetical protein